MKTTSRLLAAAFFAFALPMAASAQTAAAPAPTVTPDAKLAVGKWTGSVAPPNGDALELEFNVTAPNDSTKIDLTITAMSMTMPLTNIKLDGTKLSFSFLAGDTDVKCTLEKKDTGAYVGPCADQSGQGGPMTMVPPKKDGTN